MLFVVHRTEILRPDRDGRIRGIARPRTIVLAKQVGRDGEVAGGLRIHILGWPFTLGGVEWTVWTREWTFFSGVVGMMPWPRLKTCPLEVLSICAMIEAARRLISSPEAYNAIGSRFPWRAVWPVHWAAADGISVRQSRLRTSHGISLSTSTRCEVPL